MFTQNHKPYFNAEAGSSGAGGGNPNQVLPDDAASGKGDITNADETELSAIQQSIFNPTGHPDLKKDSGNSSMVDELNDDETPKPAETTPKPAEEPKPGETAKPAEEPAPSATVSADFLKELNYESVDQLKADLSSVKEIPNLRQQLETAKAQPKFESERAEKLFEYVNKVTSQVSNLSDDAAIRNFFRIQAIDVTTENPKALRYEAFKLRPENAGMDEKSVRAIFEDDEAKTFGDPSDIENPQSEVQKAREIQATNIAKAELTKLQQEYMTAKSSQPSAEDLVNQEKAVREEVDSGLANFGDYSLKPAFNDETNQTIQGEVKVQMTPERLQSLKEALYNPQKMWDDLLSKQGIRDSEGNMDIGKFALMMDQIKNLEQVKNDLYSQGYYDGQAANVDSKKNPTKVVPGGGTKKTATGADQRTSDDELVEGFNNRKPVYN